RALTWLNRPRREGAVRVVAKCRVAEWPPAPPVVAPPPLPPPLPPPPPRLAPLLEVLVPPLIWAAAGAANRSRAAKPPRPDNPQCFARTAHLSGLRSRTPPHIMPCDTCGNQENIRPGS